jgi:hypothetical protein
VSGKEKDEGKRMSRKKNNITTLITALGVLGLAIGLSAPRAYAQAPHAEVTLSTANYSGRYGCLVTSDSGFYTAVVKYNPSGTGTYTAGTLVASDDAFPLGLATAFCTYSLNGDSFYSIDGHGLGFEKLIWNAASTNDPSCPGTFIDNTAIALRNLININGAVIDSEFSDGNLLSQGFAGHGYCLK